MAEQDTRLIINEIDQKLCDINGWVGVNLVGSDLCLYS